MSKPYLTPAEAADYTRYRKQTIYDMVKLKRIPYIKAGKKLLFKVSELDLWLHNNTSAEAAQVIMKTRSQIAKILLNAAGNTKMVDIGNGVDVYSTIERMLNALLEKE